MRLKVFDQVINDVLLPVWKRRWDSDEIEIIDLFKDTMQIGPV